MRELKNKKFIAQQVLLQSAGPDASVSELLGRVGLTIDELIYENSNSLRWEGKSPKELSTFDKCGQEIPLVSFFTGCGGMDLGFEAVGFKHFAAFEFNRVFCDTLRVNRPHWKVFGPPFHSGNICEHEEMMSALHSVAQVPFHGVFMGGPPCQPFSIAANQRYSKAGDNFKRVGFDHKINGNLLFDFVNFLAVFRPSVFVIENVTGLRDLDNGEQLSVAMEKLKKIGYSVCEPHVLDAADHGVPQYRQRIFIVGSRRPRTFVMANKQKHIGAGSVLNQLPGPDALNNETRNHKATSVWRYSRLDYGKREQLGRVNRLDPTLPSKTVIAGGTKGGGRSHLHPEIPRTLTVRECARLQTFPDDYKFSGPIARQFTQVGNAVPPVLAAAIATQIVKSFF